MIEMRDGSDQVLKQHVWGLTYIDELVQIGINQDPENASTETHAENVCERFFWGLHDANYNVLGIVSATGPLVERYEYTPYGRRTVFTHNWLLAGMTDDGAVDGADYSCWADEYGTTDPASRADITGDGVVDGADYTGLGDDWGRSAPANDDLVTHPTLASTRGLSGDGVALICGTCDVGHQGLLFDKEFGLYYNRARYLHPTLGRFVQREPQGYADSMALYQYLMSSPLRFVDAHGEQSATTGPRPVENPVSVSITVWWGFAYGLQARKMPEKPEPKLSESPGFSSSKWQPEIGVQLTMSAPLKSAPTKRGRIEFSDNPTIHAVQVHGGDWRTNIPSLVPWWKAPGEEAAGDNLEGDSSRDKCVMCYKIKLEFDVQTASAKAAHQMASTLIELAGIALPGAKEPVTKFLLQTTKYFGKNAATDLAHLVSADRKRLGLAAVICADGKRLVGSYNHPAPEDANVSRWPSPSPKHPEFDTYMIWGQRYGTWIHSDPGGNTGVLEQRWYEASD